RFSSDAFQVNSTSPNMETRGAYSWAVGRWVSTQIRRFGWKLYRVGSASSPRLTTSTVSQYSPSCGASNWKAFSVHLMRANCWYFLPSVETYSTRSDTAASLLRLIGTRKLRWLV